MRVPGAWTTATSGGSCLCPTWSARLPRAVPHITRRHRDRCPGSGYPRGQLPRPRRRQPRRPVSTKCPAPRPAGHPAAAGPRPPSPRLPARSPAAATAAGPGSGARTSRVPGSWRPDCDLVLAAAPASTARSRARLARQGLGRSICRPPVGILQAGDPAKAPHRRLPAAVSSARPPPHRWSGTTGGPGPPSPSACTSVSVPASPAGPPPRPAPATDPRPPPPPTPPRPPAPPRPRPPPQPPPPPRPAPAATSTGTTCAPPAASAAATCPASTPACPSPP